MYVIKIIITCNNLELEEEKRARMFVSRIPGVSALGERNLIHTKYKNDIQPMHKAKSYDAKPIHEGFLIKKVG